jgi:hypothetical protein
VQAGLVGLSTFGPSPKGDCHQVNTHLDIFVWRPVRRPLDRAAAYARLCAELERRLAGDPEPLGVMTHHLVHEEESWNFLEELFSLTAKHPAVRWPKIGELFGLPQRNGLPGQARR